MSRRAAAGAVWVLGLGAAAAALQWAGRGPLAAPPLTDPGRWSAWLDGRDPIVAAFSLLRLLALAGLWYVVAVATLGALLRLFGAASLVRVADRITIAPVRRMLAGTLSFGLAASGLIAVAAPALRAPVVAQEVTTSTTSLPSATVTMHRLGPAEEVTPAVAPPAPTPAPAATAVTPQVTQASVDRWTVKPGQCFWSIAESVLTEHAGRAVSDAEIVPYWLRLIDANRPELAHRDNPDLVFPGQVFVVPAP